MSRSTEQLARAVERNQRAWITSLGELPDVQLHDESDVTYVGSRTPGRPNTVVTARFAERTADRRIAAIVDHYRALGVAVNWWVGPGSSPDDLGRRLRTSGFHCIKHFPGMAVDIQSIDSKARTPRGLAIEPLQDFSIFDRHEHPYIGPMTTPRRQALLENHRFVCAQRPRRAWAFVAMLDGAPVAHSILFIAEGVAGIYEVGVLERFRNRGIGSAITRAPLLFAADRGVRYGILQAGGDGEGLYRRLGFDEVCRISLWHLRVGA